MISQKMQWASDRKHLLFKSPSNFIKKQLWLFSNNLNQPIHHDFALINTEFTQLNLRYFPGNVPKQRPPRSRMDRNPLECSPTKSLLIIISISIAGASTYTVKRRTPIHWDERNQSLEPQTKWWNKKRDLKYEFDERKYWIHPTTLVSSQLVVEVCN